MATAEKNFPYFLLRFFHPKEQISQWFATFCIQSDCFIFFLFNTFCMRYSWVIVIFIVRLLSARYFVRIFLSSFLLKILMKTSLEVAKRLTSAFFWTYLFSLQISKIYILSLEDIFYTDFTKELCLKNVNFLRYFVLIGICYHENIV